MVSFNNKSTEPKFLAFTENILYNCGELKPATEFIWLVLLVSGQMPLLGRLKLICALWPCLVGSSCTGTLSVSADLSLLRWIRRPCSDCQVTFEGSCSTLLTFLRSFNHCWILFFITSQQQHLSYNQAHPLNVGNCPKSASQAKYLLIFVMSGILLVHVEELPSKAF